MSDIKKCGIITLCGRPNVGKSTLTNTLVGEKVAIVSSKPQTTRNRICAILNRGDSQFVFVDTPGLHKARTKLGDYMVGVVKQSVADVDGVCLLVEPIAHIGPPEEELIGRIKALGAPAALVINKIDKMQPDEFAEIYKEYEDLGLFEEIIGVSAKEGTHVENVIKEVAQFMEEGPMYFPDDMITEHPERFVVSEIIREKILMYLQDEVPHGVAVEIEQYKEEEKITKIHAVIYCEKKSHKGMIIGKGGRKLKGIGKSAREEIEVLLGTKVYLELWVKVKENWRDSDVALSNFGYKE